MGGILVGGYMVGHGLELRSAGSRGGGCPLVGAAVRATVFASGRRGMAVPVVVPVRMERGMHLVVGCHGGGLGFSRRLQEPCASLPRAVATLEVVSFLGVAVEEVVPSGILRSVSL